MCCPNTVKPVLNRIWTKRKPVFSGNRFLLSRGSEFKVLIRNGTCLQRKRLGPWLFRYMQISLH